MGKYMKKVSVMEILPHHSSSTTTSSTSSSIGVRTRARTLALQPNPELSYLQLRNRRLEKPSFPPPTAAVDSGKVSVRVGSESAGSGKGRFGHFGGGDVEQGSFGEENNLEFDSTERGTRESTPCSLIRDSEAIATPGSTTRRTCSGVANRRARSMQRAIPTTPEMEEFFAGFELHQQEQFLQKYSSV
ncbi:hypothetical protein KSS87_002985 [Heliosperma pusillum]|nr:hypothetical protein KSS87_002985 [Heliosperma pusillum]